MNIKGIILKLMVMSAMLLTLNITAADTLKIGTMFTKTTEADGMSFAIQKQNAQGGIKGYSVEPHFSPACNVENGRTLITEKKVQLLLGVGNAECIEAVGKLGTEYNILHACLSSSSSEAISQQSHPKLIVLPTSDLSLTGDLLDEYKQRYYGVLPDKSATRAYHATSIFLKAIEKSDLDLSEEKLEINSANQIEQRLLDFRVVRVSHAGFRRQASGEGKKPDADNPIIFVLQKGDKVIELDKRGDWLEVESFLEPTRRGWVHKLLVKRLQK
ncbi:MAG: hypothetical protein ABFS56_01495 [Pseudomonadota bacterium]